MPVIVVIGGQWGDEGKGRMVDLLARNASVVARYSAGNNAGHTVVTDRGIFRLHLVPAGIFYPDKVCLIGNGVVIDPSILLEEIESLESNGVSTKALFVSDRAQIIMPYHLLIDRLDEELRGPAAIGTTLRGVGPAFADKVGRVGIRMADLIRPQVFRERLSLILPYKNAFLTKLYESEPLDFNEVLETYSAFGRRLAPFVRDTMAMTHEALDKGETVLLEGAQGSLLDLDAGTYEYVTSSVPSSTAAGAGVGMGLGPTAIACATWPAASVATAGGQTRFTKPPARPPVQRNARRSLPDFARPRLHTNSAAHRDRSPRLLANGSYRLPTGIGEIAMDGAFRMEHR